jgi:hypothetical protein
MFIANDYAIGDKVLIRTDLENFNEYGGQGFVVEMEKFRGKVVTIERKEYRGYILKEDNSYGWTDDMFVGKVLSGDTVEYEVGDKLLIRDDIHSGDYINDVYINSEMAECKGTVATITGFINYFKNRLNIDGKGRGCVWTKGMFVGKIVSPVPKVEVEPVLEEEELKEFGLSDLQQGDIVEYAQGSFRKVITDIISDATGTFNRLSNYREDLMDKDGDSDLDIVKVFRTTTKSCLHKFTPDIYYDVVWEKAPEIVLTVAEIEELLGHKKGQLKIKGEK